jgi:hypothetical protein
MTPFPPDAPLQQLSAIPGVVGSVLFRPGGEVVSTQFPPVFDRAGIDGLARQLAGDAYFQEWVSGEHGALDLRYGDGTAMIRSVDGGWLLVLCTTQTNAQLLSMSLTQVVRKLRTVGQPADVRPPAAVAPPGSAGPAAPQPPSTLDRLRAIVQAELGAHAPQALEILAAASERPKDLRSAADDIEKLTKLFISTKKAAEIARRMKDVLGG